MRPPVYRLDFDYIIAQFPGGGQRGYATALLLKHLEEITELPTHQLFPNVIANSVGIVITAALYTPHPHQKSALMSAAQLCEIFPKITKRLPNTSAKFWNNNNWNVLGDVIHALIGDITLKDMLGSMQFSSHRLGGLDKSHVIFGKIINPETGEVFYSGDKDTSLMDIIRMGTAIPTIYKHHKDHIDMAFADACTIQILKLTKVLKGTGSFIRIGNFRTSDDPYVERLRKSTFIDIIFGAVFDAVADSAYATTINYAQEAFGDKRVFDLEHIFSALENKAPKTRANVTTDEQFQRIEEYVATFIEENKFLIHKFAARAKKIALERMTKYPESAFDIPAYIQEPHLPEIPDMDADIRKRPSYAFGFAAGKFVKGIGDFGLDSLKSLFGFVTSQPMTNVATQLNKELPLSESETREPSQP